MNTEKTFIVLVRKAPGEPMYPAHFASIFDRLNDASARARGLASTLEPGGIVHVREYARELGWQRGTDKLVLRRDTRHVVEVQQ